MEVTGDMDSFEALHLSEDATNEEIRRQFRFHVDMYCGKDGSMQNADGEYLFGIYQEHFKRLMDPEKKAELIEMRRLRLKNSGIEENVGSDISHDPYKNALVVLKNFEEKQKYIITLINQEIVQKFQECSEMGPRRTFSLKKIPQKFRKIPLQDVYVVIGKDCSLLFTESVMASKSGIQYDLEAGTSEEIEDNVFTLKDCFTSQNIFGTSAGYIWKNIPWDGDGIFEARGVPSFAFLASKIFPNSLVHRGMIKEYDFRKIYDIIYKYLHTNSDYIVDLFDSAYEEEREEEEKDKKESKKKRRNK